MRKGCGNQCALGIIICLSPLLFNVPTEIQPMLKSAGSIRIQILGG